MSAVHAVIAWALVSAPIPNARIAAISQVFMTQAECMHESVEQTAIDMTRHENLHWECVHVEIEHPAKWQRDSLRQ